MMLPFSFQKGNKAAGCEDAPPVSNIKFSVVCDGLGGAGSTKHKVEEAGTVVMRTSGYLGSRVVADSVTDFYDVNYERIANILFSNGNSVIALQAVIEELKSTIKTALSTKMTKLGIDPMLTRKKALKIFPTTLASALYFQDSEKLKILAIWAGDSRVYVLSPTKGLQLLSLDDAVNADREMNSASEMNNCISAGNAFRLNYSIFEMDEPGIVFCCSDGCFDYLPSPLHFEWLVLQTILSCVPNVTSVNLGEAFANSVRDSVYQSIGDDTTMAGTIYKINSTNELRETFAVRMEQFGQLAIQMNDALKVQKNWRNEKDSAAKKCRLFENKVTADLRASVTDALIKKTPTMLCSYIGTLPCYADYQESIKVIDEQVDVECVAELESLDKQLIEMKEICVEMIVRDYLRWRRINQDVIGSTSSMIDFFSTRTRGAVKKNYNYLKPSTYVQPLNACIQLLKLPDFQRLGMKNTLADADVTEFVQSQMRSIETLVSILENDSPLFEDLWSQAYFSTDRFERERQEISYSRGFSEVVAEAMNDPLHCRYITELTAQKIDSYRKMSNGMQVIQQKYMIEREKRKAVVPEQFYSLHEKELLDSFFRLDVSTLKSIFAGTNVSMDRLISFVEAKRVMSEIDDKLEKAQMNVLKIWNKYSPDYQLFKNIMEKGAV